MRTRILVTAIACLITGFAVGRAWETSVAPPRSAGDMQKAVDAALGEQDSLVRIAHLGALLVRVDEASLPGAVAAFEDHLAFVEEPEVRMLASAWARIDAPGGFEHVKAKWPQRPTRRFALSELAYQWVLENPAAAVAAVSALPAVDVASDDVPRKLIEGWARTPDYPAATDYVAGLPGGGLQQILTSTIAGEVLQRYGEDALVHWADSVRADTPGKFRLVAFRKAARTLAQVNPKAAADWVARRYGEDDTAGVTRIVVTQWAEADPEAAFAWLLSRPGDDERSQAIRFAFGDWLQRDADTASRWLEGTLPNAALDPAVDACARRVAPKDPERALGWAARIEDAELRNAAYVDIGRGWFARAPHDTRRWLASAGIDAGVAAAIQEPRPERPERAQPGMIALPRDRRAPGDVAAERKATGMSSGFEPGKAVSPPTRN